MAPSLDIDPISPQPDMLMQALEWQVTFWSGEVTDDERQAFQQWLLADTRHAAMWSQIQNTDRKLATLAKPGVGSAMRASRQQVSRRKSLRVLGLLIGTGVILQTARQTPQWQTAMADYHTAPGERRTITLADGTQLVLNTATAIDVVFDDVKRLVKMRHGEVFVVTAPDNSRSGMPRPFFIETAEGTVRPVGTRFNVRQEDRRSLVSVSEGAVEITPRASTRAPIRLQAGQQTSFDAHDVATFGTLPSANAAWMRGLLVAERMRLEDFLTELGRYRRGFVRCDPAVADLVVSGVYSTEDTDQTLASLVDALPIRVQYISRYWVTVQPHRS